MIHRGAWAEASSIPASRLTAGKVVLGIFIVASSVVPLFFVQFDDVALHLNVYKFLAKIGAFVGSLLLVWQFVLGFRGAVSSLFPDLSWVVELHKRLGQYGILVILLHPIFIGLYYLELRQTNIYALNLEHRFSVLVLVGMVLFGVIAFIAISSAIFRKRMGFYRWLYTHLSSYLVPPLLFVHSFLLGPTIQGTPLRYYWWLLTGLVAVFFLYRAAHKFGLFAARYRVSQVRQVAAGTTELLLTPQGHYLKPQPGQFIYLRASIKENSHPYTVSAFEKKSGRLGITVKEEGRQTTRLQNVQEGDSFLLDGPFGIFTRLASASHLPMVMIAGGIGITAFSRLWRNLEAEGTRDAYLFYANEFYSDIAYRDEIDSLKHVRVVHVLNQEPDFPGEKGFVTVDLLRRNLQRPLKEYQFMICGPPVMILKLEDGLTEAGIPKRQVRHELFSS